jgi:hypothetical protein
MSLRLVPACHRPLRARTCGGPQIRGLTAGAGESIASWESGAGAGGLQRGVTLGHPSGLKPPLALLGLIPRRGAESIRFRRTALVFGESETNVR